MNLARTNVKLSVEGVCICYLCTGSDDTHKHGATSLGLAGIAVEHLAREQTHDVYKVVDLWVRVHMETL